MKKLYNSGYVHEHVIKMSFVCIEYFQSFSTMSFTYIIDKLKKINVLSVINY